MGWACSGWDEITPIQEQALPDLRILDSHPNPFNPSTTISYEISEVSQVNLVIYDVSGRQIAELVNGYRDAGMQEVTLDASSLPSGVYFARLTAGDFQQIQKLLLVK